MENPHNDSRQPESEGEPRLCILIASNVRFLREALAEVFGHDRHLSVVGLAADQNETLAKTLIFKPDVVLLDAGMPHGLETIEQLRHASGQVRTIVFAVADEEENVLSWVEAGVEGFVPSTSSLTDVVDLVSGILRGRQQCSQQMASALLHRIASLAEGGVDRRAHPRSPTVLTKREREIMRLLSSGMSNKEIARLLNIEVATAKTHVHNLMVKLQLQRRSQAARWMAEQQL